jgi:hypothetical protein
VPTILGGGTLEFRERLFALKEMALMIAGPRIEEYFVNQFNRVYPNFTYNNGLKVKSLDNMKTAYCTEPYNNQMREMIYYWGKSVRSMNACDLLMVKEVRMVLIK